MLKIIFVQIVLCFWMSGITSGFCMEKDNTYNSYDISERLEKLEIYFETEMYEEASTLLDGLIGQFPDEPKFEYLRAIVDYQRQNYDRASRVFLKFIERYPEVAEPYYLLGKINLEKRELEKARQYLVRYCELVPEDYDAQCKLNSLSNNSGFPDVIVIKDGKENSGLVTNVGFYGACVYSWQNRSIRLIHASFRSRSSMGIDFAYPIDLREKQIILKLRGQQGGERFELTFRDKFAPDFNPQLVVVPEQESLSCDWQKITVAFANQQPKIDLSQIVHIGLEFGTSTAGNPPTSTLFVRDIIIEDVHN